MRGWKNTCGIFVPRTVCNDRGINVSHTVIPPFSSRYYCNTAPLLNPVVDNRLKQVREFEERENARKLEKLKERVEALISQESFNPRKAEILRKHLK